MLLRRAWGTTLRRLRSPRATTALASPFSSVKDDERHTVQVLHTRPPTSYVDVEQDIAALQRDIRTAYNSGAYQAALDAGLQCRDLVKTHFGEDHAVYASTVTNIALMHKNMGQLDEAIEAYEFALQTYKASVGEQHASFATTLYNLGLVYRAMALSSTGLDRVTALHRALDCIRESLKIRREILEPGHPDIALSLSNMGVIHWQNKQPDKAFAMLTEAVEMLEKKTGAESVLTALAKNNLAYARKEAREYDDAIKLYEEVLSVRKQVLGSAHNETIMARHNLAEAYRASGNEDKAVQVQNEILDLFDAELGPEETK
ncbi:unnamed protein product [Hyaloperonospora brassicae]|uniref:Kinesin light chain n=1 Tax=Hyaloperonospora brassicae TaxID=162125 RepID=A0AAV0TDL8_HYABA|nr:unnamed protein product [Hyaloperonospora brassicae]